VPRHAQDPDPVSLIAHFGSELRTLRDEAGLSRPQLGEVLGYTGQWIGQVELTKSNPSEQFAIDLDTYFKTGGLFFRLWKSIRRATNRRVLLPGFPRYLELEAEAGLIRAFVTQLVPGLLQTESYARAVISAWSNPEPIEDRVATRIERQQVLSKENPPTAWFVLDEAVLHRPFGGRKVMAEQLTWLAEFAESPHVQVRVLPFSSMTYAGLDGMFTLLRLANGDEVVYQEGPALSQLIDAPDIVADCAVRFDLVMGEALPRAESHKMILRALENLT
jgi:transcriptional regulator with XRE-family HTH domain